MALVAGLLMGFGLFNPREQQAMEHVQDETRRKRGAHSGDPVDPGADNAPDGECS